MKKKSEIASNYSDKVIKELAEEDSDFSSSGEDLDIFDVNT